MIGRSLSLATGLLVITVFLVTCALLVPVPPFSFQLRYPALFHGLENFGHPLAFLGLTIVSLRARLQPGAGDWWMQRWLLTLLVAFAGMTEVLQGITGRDTSFLDFTADLLGVCAGLLWNCGGTVGRWLAVTTLAIAGLPLAGTLAAYTYRHMQAPLIWRNDSWLLGHFAQSQDDSYPGLTLLEVPPDWRSFQEMRISVRNSGDRSTRLVVRVHDIHHDQRYEDRFNRIFMIAARSTVTIEVPLDDVMRAPANRNMDMRSIASVLVFQPRDEATPSLVPTEISLRH